MIAAAGYVSGRSLEHIFFYIWAAVVAKFTQVWVMEPLKTSAEYVNAYALLRPEDDVPYAKYAASMKLYTHSSLPDDYVHRRERLDARKEAKKLAAAGAAPEAGYVAPALHASTGGHTPAPAASGAVVGVANPLQGALHAPRP